jgi:S1-C subfamily serine protease
VSFLDHLIPELKPGRPAGLFDPIVHHLLHRRVASGTHPRQEGYADLAVLPVKRGQHLGVDPRSSGARAGLKSGDIVTEIGDRPVRDAAFLRNRLALLRIGDVAELAVLRDGKTLKIRATVAQPDQSARARSPPPHAHEVKQQT